MKFKKQVIIESAVGLFSFAVIAALFMLTVVLNQDSLFRKERPVEIVFNNAMGLRVGDTGPGLPPKAKEHLFAAFQGGARKGGTGLGLAIAADLIRAHGGEIALLRSDSDGTEFEILLPKEISEAEDDVF